jgi:hypothetical protein
MQHKKVHDIAAVPRRAVLAAAIAALFVAPPAQGFEIDTGNPDITMRWDNTVRYNLGIRAQRQNDQILGNPNYDDGDRNFSNGSIVTNRLDLLSEFDFVYQRKYGFRASYAAWYDNAYNHLDNTDTATANTLVDGLPVAGALSPYTKRYSKGVSGEWLDAFIFANTEVADVPVNVKAGQHTVFWGDSLLLGGAVHSVSYSQNPLDLQKGFMTPGSEAKELFRPRGGITLQAQATPELSLAGQWFYAWQSVRVPESGSYLTINDALNWGADSQIFGPNPFAATIPGAPAMTRLWRGQDIRPTNWSSSLGDFGLSARWSPAWLDGTIGFYGRNTTDTLPQVMATPGLATTVPAALCTKIGGIPLGGTNCIINPQATSVAELQKFGKVGTYNTAYGDNIHIYGLTLAKEIGGISWAGEFSYRQNMPLLSTPVFVVPAPLVPNFPGAIATTAVPSKGTPGALGDTYHGLINGINIWPKTALFDTATLQGELTWMQYGRITQNAAVFKGSSNYVNADGTTPIDKVTRNFVGLAFNFTPTWFQVWPGVDLSAPLTWSSGISGNAAVLLGGNKDNGTWSAGVAADIYQKYKVQLSYNGYFGNYSTTATSAMNVPNGAFAALSDRGWVSLTFKTTF